MNVMARAEMTALSIGKGITLNNADELEAMLRHIGATRYHNLHPFHRLLHGGKLNKGQVQAWALNRYFYQSTIAPPGSSGGTGSRITTAISAAKAVSSAG